MQQKNLIFEIVKWSQNKESEIAVRFMQIYQMVLFSETLWDFFILYFFTIAVTLKIYSYFLLKINKCFVFDILRWSCSHGQRQYFFSNFF